MSASAQDRTTWPILPDLLYFVAEAFGLEVALRFAERFGGRYLYVSAKRRPDDAVVQLFGEPMAVRLREYVEARPGVTARRITVPIGPKGEAAGTTVRMEEAAAAMRGRGLKASEIAALLGCHVRTVYRLKVRHAERQAYAAARHKRQEQKS